MYTKNYLSLKNSAMNKIFQCYKATLEMTGNPPGIVIIQVKPIMNLNITRVI